MKPHAIVLNHSPVAQIARTLGLEFTQHYRIASASVVVFKDLAEAKAFEEICLGQGYSVNLKGIPG